MDLGTALGLLVGFLGFAATVAGAFVKIGELKRSVKANADEIAELKEEQRHNRTEIEEAQRSARAVDGLAKAVEHMGERFADQIKHLVETFSIETGHTRSQLADIKEELRSVRSARSQARSRAGGS